MRPYQLSLASGETRRFLVNGDFVRLTSGANVRIRFFTPDQQPIGPVLDLAAGQSMRLDDPFGWVEVENLYAGTNAITLTLGFGMLNDATSTGVSGLSAQRSYAGADPDTTAKTSYGTADYIIPRNPNRKGFFCQCLATSAVSLAVSVDRQIPGQPQSVFVVAAGDTLYLPVVDQLVMYAAATGTTTFTFIELF